MSQVLFGMNACLSVCLFSGTRTNKKRGKSMCIFSSVPTKSFFPRER